MKHWGAAFLAAIFFLLPAKSFSYNLGSVRISLLDGDVQVRAQDSPDWFAGSINMPLREGDRIWVPEGGRLEFQLRDGTYVRLNEKTSLDVLRLEKDAAHLYLEVGHAYVNYRGMKGGLLQMETAVSSFRVYDKARFRADVASDGYTEVSVFSGTVYAESRGGSTTVNAGKTLYAGRDLYAELSPLGPADEWEEWNVERDRRLSEKRYSTRYLPDELDVYAYDFDTNGKWVYVRDYGYCWTPTVVVAGWSPYRLGRWTWFGNDYIWVSYDPWGWVPYHYGRWSFSVSIGWFWVPPVRGAVYWGPGFVGWVHTPTYVSWVPLAPGEIYYGYGYYGPHSVNITNINITNIQITKVYKNAYFTDAVVATRPDCFSTGRCVDVRVKENPFLAHKISVGRPPVTPERTGYRFTEKVVPAVKQPPQQIRNVQVDAIREARPIVRNRNESVLNPGSRATAMPLKTLREPKSGIGETGRELQRPATRETERGVTRGAERAPRETGRELQRPATRETERGVTRGAERAPRETGRELQRPATRETERGVTRGAERAPRETGRELQRPATRETERGVTRGAERAPREMQRQGSEVTPKETGRQGVQQKERIQQKQTTVKEKEQELQRETEQGRQR